MLKRLLLLVVCAFSPLAIAQTNIIPTENTTPVTWTGQHTFNLLPLVPGTPTTANQAVNYGELQAYVAANSFTSGGGQLTGPLYLPSLATLGPLVYVTYPQFGTPSSCPNVADPTDVNDSSCAIQAAVTYAQTHSVGGVTPTVYFPPGKYKITSNITDNGTVPYSANNAILAISSGHTVSIGNVQLASTVPLSPNLNVTVVNPQTEVFVNPLSTNNVFGATVGRNIGYIYTGTIPGTSQFNFGQVNHYTLNEYFVDSTPGCYGYATTCYNSEHSYQSLTSYISGAGGAALHQSTAYFYSVGDHIGSENYVNSMGGSIDGGGPEGTKGTSNFVNEIGDAWTGHVATGHGGQGQTALVATCATECGSSGYGLAGGIPAGMGQSMIVTDEQATVASGQTISYTAASGEVLGTVTVNITSGLSNLAVSTCVATLNSTISPVTNPSGSGSQSVTFNVTDVSGTCTANQIFSFAGTNHEQAVVASATAPVGGVQTITLNARLYHESGSYVFENTNSDAGLFMDIVANHNGTLEFPVEIVGVQSIVSNTVVFYWRRWYAGGQPGFVPFPAGFMVAGTAGIAALSNSAGTVTFSIFLNWNVNGVYWSVLNGKPYIYISSATNSVFNGICTNVTISFPQGVNPGTGTCTQAASTGQTSSNAQISLTDSTQDNPYGNTRSNFYQGAAIVDPQDYTNSITVQGIVSYPVDGLQFAVEPNEMPLTAGDALVEHHSAPQFHNITGTVDVVSPNCYTCSGIDLAVTGIYLSGSGGVLNDGVFNGRNNTPLSNYSDFGGNMVPAPFITTFGLFGDVILMNNPPFLGNSIVHILNCPQTSLGCADPTYNYGLYYFLGNGGVGSATFYPYNNTMVYAGSFVYSQFAGGGIQCLDVDNTGKLGVTGALCGVGGGGGPTDVENDVSCVGTCTLSNAATINVITLTGNVTSSTLAAPGGPFHTNILVCENATGGYTFTPPSNIQWITATQITTASTCTGIEEVYSTTLGVWQANGPGVTGE